MVGIDVPWRQVALAVLHKTVTGEIDDDPVGGLRDRRQPFLQLAANVGERGVGAFQEVDILCRERAALVVD